MKIKINISRNRIRVGDLRRAQADDIDATLRLIASCMVGPDGEYLQREEALAQLDELDLDTLEEEVINPFMAALEVQRTAAVNPRSGGRH